MAESTTTPLLGKGKDGAGYGTARARVAAGAPAAQKAAAAVAECRTAKPVGSRRAAPANLRAQRSAPARRRNQPPRGGTRRWRGAPPGEPGSATARAPQICTPPPRHPALTRACSAAGADTNDEARFYLGVEKAVLFNTHEDGLTEAEAVRRLEKFGRNQLPEKEDNKLMKLAMEFIQPMPLMIWAAIFIEVRRRPGARARGSPFAPLRARRDAGPRSGSAWLAARALLRLGGARARR